MSQVIKNIFRIVSKKRLAYYVATVFNLGKLPVFPGTWGSAGGLLLCLALHKFVVLYVAVFLAIFFAGVIASGRIEHLARIKDPSYVVIDEFACIFVVYFLVPITATNVIAGFMLYRLFDIIKLQPIRRLEKIHGGWGIMLDDLMAAVYTNLILQYYNFVKNP